MSLKCFAEMLCAVVMGSNLFMPEALGNTTFAESLTGFVVDAETQIGLPDAEVSIYIDETLVVETSTGPDGAFEFLIDLEKDIVVDFEIVAENYTDITYSGFITVTSDEDLHLKGTVEFGPFLNAVDISGTIPRFQDSELGGFTIAKIGILSTMVSGIVLDDGTSQEIQGARLILQEQQIQTSSDTDGFYYFPLVIVEPVTIRIFAEGYQQQEFKENVNLQSPNNFLPLRLSKSVEDENDRFVSGCNPLTKTDELNLANVCRLLPIMVVAFGLTVQSRTRSRSIRRSNPEIGDQEL